MPDEAVPELEDRFHELCDLWPRDRVEIVNDRIVVNRVPTTNHNDIVFELLMQLGVVARRRGWRIWPDIILFFGRQADRCRPDLTAVPPRPRAWSADHIFADQALLVVEVVSKSSVDDDHRVKPEVYSRGGIPLYLLVDPFEERVRLFSEPDRAEGTYRSETTVAFGEKLNLPEPWDLALDTAPLLA